ncbi:MAG: GNAT family N-acetyltransferase [Dysgonomonas sp.]|nr:GNAT family N-acetyltransferase [Dysgonomonas sp.]
MNYTFHKIKSSKDKWYKPYREIYEVSFPVFEQRSEVQQLKAFESASYHLLIATEDEKLLSFISYWEFDGYVYIEHLAVNPEFRGQNIGSETLDLFANQIQKMVILEIDPPIDDISKKRLHFYEALGYKLNPFIHHHPAYHPSEYNPHELRVLSLDKEIKEKEYKQFCADLDNIVMAE